MDSSIKIIVTDNRGAFTERAWAIQDALRIMGYRVDIDTYDAKNIFGGLPVNEHPSYDCRKENRIKLADVNIFLNGHRIIPDQKKINICIQTEQLSFNRFKDFAALTGKWTLILDLFKRQALGGNVRYFPMGYSPHFDYKGNVDRVNELYFYGSMTPHRERLVKKFKISSGLNYGYARDYCIKSSKAIIYMHWCPAMKYWVPPFRALMALCKGRFFLHEQTAQGCGIYDDMCMWFTENSLGRILEHFTQEIMDSYAANIRENLMRNHKFEDHFREAVKGIL